MCTLKHAHMNLHTQTHMNTHTSHIHTYTHTHIHTHTHTHNQTTPPQGDLFKKLIRSGGVLEERYVASEVVLPLLLTLQHLHSVKIYHRDIK